MTVTLRCLRWVLLLASLPLLSAGAFAQSSLGRLDFPTSGSPPAQAHFLRGVLALHSFWFEEALDEFRAATRLDPGFAMGYWGEAMAHNHPLWAEQNAPAAREALRKIRGVEQLTPRERDYIEAVKLLYGAGDKLSRDLAYSAAMEKLCRQFPDDLEAAAFYSLSLLGAVRPDDKGFRRQMQAGAIALEIFAKNPDHPGAAHYIIHAFDDPDHAVLALPAARRYAGIAPEAHHARHMPSHIFLQLGMWPEAAASNESAWAASVAWVERKKLPLALRDYHSLHWLAYVYFQQGRRSRAEELLALRRAALAEALPRDSSQQFTSRPDRYYADMSAMLVIETGEWQRAAELFDPPENYSGRETPGAQHLHGAAPRSSAGGLPSHTQILAAFIRGLAAAGMGVLEMEKSIELLGKYHHATREAGDTSAARNAEIMQLEVAATARAFAKRYDDAIAVARLAVAREEELPPPSGPPDLVKPSHELLGEILLMANRTKEALAQFHTSLSRQPNRALSLLGAARAAARLGDRPAAAAYYSALLDIWQQADPQLPELREARDFVSRTAARSTASPSSR